MNHFWGPFSEHSKHEAEYISNLQYKTERFIFPFRAAIIVLHCGALLSLVSSDTWSKPKIICCKADSVRHFIPTDYQNFRWRVVREIAVVAFSLPIKKTRHLYDGINICLALKMTYILSKHTRVLTLIPPFSSCPLTVGCPWTFYCVLSSRKLYMYYDLDFFGTHHCTSLRA